LQSTFAAPSNLPRAYQQFAEDAKRVEELGFDSLWMAEHRFWYDGWCPQPLVAISAAAAVTSRLRFGTAMLLLPQHDPVRFARLASSVSSLSGGRLDLGVGLGHRDAEFDGLGVRRDQRGARMTRGIEALLACDPSPPLWMGGMAPAALERGASRGMGFVLPQTLYLADVTKHVASVRRYADAAGVAPGPIGILKDCWVTGAGGSIDDSIRDRMARHYREEAGAWWVLKGASTGFQRPEMLDAQLQRIADTSIVGSPEFVIAELAELRAAGMDLAVLRFWFDVTAGPDAWKSMQLFADEGLTDRGHLV
jgi:alkanesulfonate monooxygenase SsuD/methylene tetrahydromethanopterin reductase-like flavin-dependent oxidoreductase (luciferase family)